MAMHVRIYKPAKTAMQSGRAKTKDWVLEYEVTDRSTPDPIMGWNGSMDTRRQVRLTFDTVEEAVAYAQRHGYTYTVQKPRERKIQPRSYAENFSYRRLEPWTH